MTANEIDKLKQKFISDSLKDLDKALSEFTKSLVKKILDEVSFDITAGKIDYSQRNFSIANEVSARLDKYLEPLGEMFKAIGKQMLETANYDAKYFSQLTSGEVTSSQIYAKLATISTAIGIDMQGNIIKDSYIDNLTKSAKQSVRNNVINYLNQSISGQTHYREFAKGFKELLIGTKGVDPTLVRYSKQYVHDTMFQVSAKISEAFAERLDLKYFLYEGDVIETTRPFCEERAGNVYSVDDVKSWPKALPYFQENYDFFIHRGGYNCRHNIKYISERQAERMGYKTKKD